MISKINNQIIKIKSILDNSTISECYERNLRLINKLTNEPLHPKQVIIENVNYETKVHDRNQKSLESNHHTSQKHDFTFGKIPIVQIKRKSK